LGSPEPKLASAKIAIDWMKGEIMRKLLLLGVVVTAVVGFAGGADAKRAKTGNNACTAEIKRFCGAGGPDILRGSCLKSHLGELSPACRGAVETAAKN
jgi:hypothetical protein